MASEDGCLVVADCLARLRAAGGRLLLSAGGGVEVKVVRQDPVLPPREKDLRLPQYALRFLLEVFDGMGWACYYPSQDPGTIRDYCLWFDGTDVIADGPRYHLKQIRTAVATARMRAVN